MTVSNYCRVLYLQLLPCGLQDTLHLSVDLASCLSKQHCITIIMMSIITCFFFQSSFTWSVHRRQSYEGKYSTIA